MKTILIAVVAAAACATARPNYGSVAIKPIGNAGAPPANFTVGAGHISGRLVDAYVENGCLRGTMGQLPLQLCDEGNGRWAGSSGEVTTKLTPDGSAVAVEGQLMLRPGQVMQLGGERLELGQGKQWDELRKQPVLLVVATAAADLRGGNLMVQPGY
ncbi:MAG TPA: hypothetical protein VLW85_02990 [Myxococcales bacterium]|nr:hypothetical protein [Myxococcales bacterium]